MERMRLEPKNRYIIEVNDNGDTIEFDLDDIELPFKMLRCMDGLQEAEKEMQKQFSVIENLDEKKNENSLFSEKEAAIFEALKTYYQKTRKAMDEFLGENACQKIFGDKNYLSMWDDLVSELTKPQEDGKSHFDKMGITFRNTVDRITNKYSSSLLNESVLK